MDRDANFVGIKITGLKEAHIVGGNHRQPALFSQRHGGMEIALFIRTTGTDQFQIITIREVLFIERHTLIHQRHIATQQGFADVTHTAA